MTEPQNAAPFETVTRHIVMERHINPHGHVFGGVLLAWLDESAGLFAMDNTGCVSLVTVSMDDVAFKAPCRRGDQVAIQCRLYRIGRSSVCIQAQAVVYDPAQCTQHEIITCEITYVCLKDEKPCRYFLSPEYEAWLERKLNAKEGGNAAS